MAVLGDIEVGDETEKQTDRLVEIGDVHAFVRVVAAVLVAHEEHGALGYSPRRRWRRRARPHSAHGVARICRSPAARSNAAISAGDMVAGSQVKRGPASKSDATLSPDLGEERVKPRFDPLQHGGIGAAHIEREAKFAEHAAAAMLARIGIPPAQR